MNLKLFEAWMQTRPQCIKELAREFPLHTQVQMPQHRDPWYVVGWNEADMLLVSPLTLEEDYDRAMELQQRVCADHYR